MKTIASPIRVIALTNAVHLVMGFVTSVLLARWMGPEGRGAVAAALLWPMLLVFIGSVGLIPSTLYFSAQHRGAHSQAVFANAIVISTFLSLLLLPLAYLALPYVLSSQSPAVVDSARFFLAVFPVSLVTQSGTSILQAQMRLMLFNAVRSLIPLGYLVGTVVLRLWGSLSVSNIVALLLALHVVYLLGTVFALRRAEVSISARGNMALARRMLRYGLQAQVGDVSQAANLRADQTLIAAWLPADQLGLYVTAVGVTNVQQVLSVAVRMVVMPRVAGATTPTAASSLLTSTFRKYAFISVATALALTLLLPIVFIRLYGRSFGQALGPAEVLVVATLLLGLKDVLAGAVQALGKPWLATRAELVALIATAILLPLSLIRIGIMGAALTSVVVYAIALSMLVRSLHRSNEISPSELLRPRPEDLKSFLPSRLRSRG